MTFDFTIRMHTCSCGDCGRYYAVQDTLFDPWRSTCPYCASDTIRRHKELRAHAVCRLAALKGQLTRLRKAKR